VGRLEQGKAHLSAPGALANGWPDFMRDYWGKKPAHFRLAADYALPGEEQLMRLVRLATQSDPAQWVRLFLGSSRCVDDMRPFYPADTGANLDTYLRRAATCAGAGFTLVINNAQQHDLELCRWLGNFSRGLSIEVGLALRSDVVLYASTTPKTAFGVHKDRNHNFLFPMVGRKRFHMWPWEALQNKSSVIGSTHYDEILGDGEVYDVERGSLLYIPSNYYHVAQAENQPWAHVSLMTGVDQTCVATGSCWRSLILRQSSFG
jgi:ribosomal protein L16 Arg81 hydroxylase